MNIKHRVTGYDKRTERLAYWFDVPADRMADLRALASVESADADVLGSYPLSDHAAHSVADQLKLPMPVERCDWFLEPVALD